MIPDIVEIKKLCASGQWVALIEKGAILLHDSVSGETVRIGETAEKSARHGRWYVWCGEQHTRNGNLKRFKYYECSECGCCTAIKSKFCSRCGAKMDGGL